MNASFLLGFQVCEAGLHIYLGVGLRLYNYLEKECQILDFKLISSELGEGNPVVLQQITELSNDAKRRFAWMFSVIKQHFIGINIQFSG